MSSSLYSLATANASGGARIFTSNSAMCFRASLKGRQNEQTELNSGLRTITMVIVSYLTIILQHGGTTMRLYSAKPKL